MYVYAIIAKFLFSDSLEQRREYSRGTIGYVLPLKILSYRKLKLVDEDLLEGIEVVLLVENEHRLLVVNGIDGAETQWAIAVGN